MRTLAHLLAVFVCCAPPAIAQISPTFATADFTAASRPRAIAHADFDRDGWLDVATAGHDGIAVLLNNEGHGFGSRYRSASPGGGAFDLAAGDLNRDDIPDLVVAQADGNTVDVHLGNGDGTFVAPLRIPIAGGSPRGIALVDHDGDGTLDIIATEYATNAWRILYGNGAGAFDRQARFGAIARPQGVLAADFNRDGRPDVAIAGAGIDLVAVFFSTSSGGHVQRNVSVRGAVNVLAAGDYNHDGWLDLSAASSSNSEIYTLIGGPSGLTWSLTTASGSSPRGIVAADVNQDGRLDLMTANRASSTVNVHLGTGSGTFGAAQAVPAGSGSRALAAGDFDHDGRVDLVTVNESASTATLLVNTTPFVAPAFRFTRQVFDGNPGFSGPYGLETGDFDRDGRLDVVTWANGIVVRLAAGSKATITTAAVNDVVVADINRDGAFDLASADFHRREVRVFLNRGDGTFAQGLQAFAGFVSGLASADFNRDGHADLVVQETSSDQGLRILLGRGDGTFEDGGTTFLDSFLQQFVTADLDRDGDVDIVGASADPAGFVVWYGKGDGTSSRVVSYSMPSNLADVAVGDLNEDGVLDLITAYDFSVYVRLGLAAGGFGAPTEHPAALRRSGVFVYDIGVGDVNLDGHLDVLTNDADILFGNGDGNFTFDARSGFDGYYQDPEVADVNSDGLQDLLFNQGGGLLVMLNERGGTNRQPTVSAGADFTVSYPAVNGYGDDYSIDASGEDPDLHELRFEWRDSAGTVLSTEQSFWPQGLPAGRHTFTVTAYDGRGGHASDSMVLTVLPYEEIYFHTFDFASRGAWRRQADGTAASGALVRHPNANAPKVAAPLASPTNYIETDLPGRPDSDL